MKVRNCWFALLLVGSSIISVSPNSSTTAITTFQPSYSSRTSSEAISSKLDSLQNYMLRTTDSQLTSEYQNMLVKGIQFPPHRQVREAEAAQNDAVSPCYQFEIGDPDEYTLSSPNFPENYPKNIDCVRILEAPEGFLIRLDFRDSFKIEEKEECKFDFLEIRDGAYGFSRSVGKYCGEEFPDIIDSKGRFLWLRFHSDESIEYSGFKAVYEFIKMPQDAQVQELNCIIRKDKDEGHINITDIAPGVITNATRNNIALECMWIITVRDGWKISLKFLKFELDKPNDCESNFLDVFSEKTDMPSRLRNFCGSAAEAVHSTFHILHLRFFARPNAINSSFDALYTAYRDKGNDCSDDEFDCEDATCISKKLRCNGRDNCKFRADEEDCQKPTTGQSEHVIIIIVIFGLILGGMVATFLVNCIRKLLRDQQIIREHIRQSKESKLNEMGRASAKRSRENLSVKLSPREKHSESSLRILDDISKRYYREMVPITVEDGKTDVKEDSILKQRHDIVVQTSLGDENSSPERGTNEMGCQTRESLFQPVGWKTSICSSSPKESAAIRFSTFGYDAPPGKAQSLSRQTTRDKSRTTPTGIDIDETAFTEILPRGPEVCLHHHQHQQHLQQQQQKMQQLQHHQHQHPHQHQHQHQSSGKGGKQKVDESKVFIDIRNSAPDVIIMTSH